MNKPEPPSGNAHSLPKGAGLVLLRNVNERIVITRGADEPPVVITLVDIERGRVRIGIHAPAEYVIDREEIYLKKLSKSREASASNERSK